jgi:hypothetical protein
VVPEPIQLTVGDEVLCHGYRCIVTELCAYGPNPINTYYRVHPMGIVKPTVLKLFKNMVACTMLQKISK